MVSKGVFNVGGMFLMWLKQGHVYHPPVITISMAGFWSIKHGMDGQVHPLENSETEGISIRCLSSFNEVVPIFCMNDQLLPTLGQYFSEVQYASDTC